MAYGDGNETRSLPLACVIRRDDLLVARPSPLHPYGLCIWPMYMAYRDGMAYVCLCMPMYGYVWDGMAYVCLCMAYRDGMAALRVAS